MSGPLTSVLAGGHARLDGLLRRALTAGGAVDRAASAEFRAGLLTHISLEEKILLPAAQRWQGGVPLPFGEAAARSQGPRRPAGAHPDPGDPRGPSHRAC